MRQANRYFTETLEIPENIVEQARRFKSKKGASCYAS